MHIKSLTLKNFKSFKNTTVEFNTGYNCIVGPNGSGKCLKGDSAVLLSDGSIRTIKDIVETSLSNGELSEIDDGKLTIQNPENLGVFSINTTTGKIEIKKIQAFVKRTSPEKLVEIRTRSGKTVTSTTYHPVMTIENGRIVSIKAGDLKLGERIATQNEGVIKKLILRKPGICENTSLAEIRSTSGSALLQLKSTLQPKLEFELDEIAEIKDAPKEDWVYDLCVEGNHNFLAEGIFVHNSNVIDSVLFAFNEGSIRRLRAKKVGDLIHKNARICEVTTTFDDGSYIVRAVRNDGKIKYLLNGKPSKKYAVDEFLSSKSLSPNNVIQQGQVQHIVEISPKERRLLIDDLANVSEFENKKREALSELGKVEEKLNEASAILSEREGFLKELEREKEDAEKYMQLKRKKESTKASILTQEISEIEAEFDSIANEMFSLNEKFKQIESEIASFNNRISSKQKEREDIHNQIMQRSSGKQATLQNEIDELNAKVSKASTLIEEKTREIEKGKLRLEELTKDLAKTSDEKRGASERLGEVATEARQLEAGLNREELQLDELMKKSQAFSSEFQNARQELEIINNEMLKCKEDLGNIQVEVSKIKEAQSLKEKELQRLKIGNFEDYSNKKAELKLQKEEFQKLVDIEEKEVNRLFDDERRANKQLTAIEDQLIYLREKVAVLQSKLKSVREDGGNAAAEIAMEVKGIHGTVQQLISYDSEFSVPIQIAMGGRGNYLIAENVKAVQEAVALLKRAGKMRASFIPLDKIKASQVNEEDKRIARHSASKGFAIDKLEYDRKFERAIQYAFGNTLITTTLEECKELVGRIRFATMQGELSEASGVISGGAIPEKANLLKDRADLEKFEKELAELKGQKDMLMQSMQENREEASRRRKAKAELEIKKRGFELEEENIKRVENEQLEKKKDLKAAIDQLQKEIDALQHEIESQDSTRMELIRKLSQFNVQALQCKQKIDVEKEEKFGIALKEREKRISELRISLATLNSREEALKKEVQIYEKQAQSIEKELQQQQDEGQQNVESIKNCKQDIAEGKQLRKLKEEELKSISQALKDLFDKREEIEKQLQILGNTKGKLEFEREKIEKDNSSKLVKKAVIETNMANLKAEMEEFKGAEIIQKERAALILELKECESEIEKIGNVNLKAIEMYSIKSEELQQQKNKTTQLRQEKEVVMKLMEEIEGKKIATFMETYNTVNNNFQKLFSTIFKGQGSLYLENIQNPFEGGLTIQAKLDNKEVKYLELMSGGEKSLIALIFIFSIQACNPSTVYILDEADAALDQENSRKLSQLLKELSKESQFVIITHNPTIYKSAETLIGVAMFNQESRIVEVNLEKLEGEGWKKTAEMTAT